MYVDGENLNFSDKLVCVIMLYVFRKREIFFN